MLDLTVLAILNKGAWQIKDGYTFFGIPPPIERWISYLPIMFWPLEYGQCDATLVLGLALKRTGSFCLGLLVPWDHNSCKNCVYHVRSATTLLERLYGEADMTWGGKEDQLSPALKPFLPRGQACEWSHLGYSRLAQLQTMYHRLTLVDATWHRLAQLISAQIPNPQNHDIIKQLF